MKKELLTENQVKIMSMFRLLSSPGGFWTSEISKATKLSGQTLGGALSGLVRAGEIEPQMRRWNKELGILEKYYLLN